MKTMIFSFLIPLMVALLVVDARGTIIEKYPDQKGIDFVSDAPWRVVVRPDGWVPVLLFIPDSRGNNIDDNFFRGIRFKRITIYVNETKVFEALDGALPVVGKDMRIIEENGNPVANIIDGISRCNGEPVCDVIPPGGWHRIIRIPINRIPQKEIIFLRTEIVAEQVFMRPFHPPKTVYYSRSLRVQLSKYPFPSFGESWRYFDVHMHTIAEWSLRTDLIAPRQAFGGPIQFIKESAYAMGLTDLEALNDSAKFRNRVIATDHNAFLSDEYRINVGPTSGTPNSFIRNTDRFKAENGQKEFQLMREIFGYAYGEEVALRNENLFKEYLNFGSHLLVMRVDHFDGPWHGGKVLDMPVEKNKNSIESTLSVAAKTPRSFAYIAHPFQVGNYWTNSKLEALHDRSRRFIIPAVNPEDKSQFVLKGAQYWNEKNDLSMSADDGVIQFFDLHPFPDEANIRIPRPAEIDFKVQEVYTRFKPNLTWDLEMQKGLVDWHRRIRQLFQFSFEDRPDEIFPRKIYIAGGSDAHGNFNFSTSLLATLLDNALVNELFPSQRSVTNNAFAKVRTYVNSEGKSGSTIEERALNALSDGNSVVTDGPVITFDVDVDCRFDNNNLSWDENAKLPTTKQPYSCNAFNSDGRIGGNGSYDTEWTALVVKGSKDALIRYRWNNTTEFGGLYGGPPREIRLYVDTPDNGEPETQQEIRKWKSDKKVLNVLTPHYIINKESLPPVDSGGFESLYGMGVPITGPMALSLGIFADRKLDDRTESFSGYTNPIWINSVSITRSGESSKEKIIPKGTLKIIFTFDLSMKAEPVEVGLLPLDAQGKSAQTIIFLQADGVNSGWSPGTLSDGSPIKNAVYQVTNNTDIDTSLTRFNGKFVVYVKEPKDIHGNKMNSVADTIIIGPQ